MPITPDTKNWTWVIEKTCPECGYDGASIVAKDVPTLVRRNAAAWPAVLERADVRVRPDDSTWSPLEYAAHVRDVHRLYDYRLALMLEQDAPSYPNWDQDATAEAERYNDQDPAVVAAELASAAASIADALEKVPDDAWERTGHRSDGVVFTIDTFARYYLHDPVHHLHDVTK